MIEIRPFAPRDLDHLDLQAVQQKDLPARAHALQLIVAPNEAWTCVVDGRRVVAIAGVVHFSATRARAWALIGHDITPRAWGAVSLKMGARLTALQDAGRGGKLRRIEAETVLDFVGGHRLLQHLGFRYETHMPGAGPNGETYALYARLADRPGDRLNRLEAIRALAFRTLVDEIMPPPAKEVA